MQILTDKVTGKYGFERAQLLDHLGDFIESLKNISPLALEDEPVRDYLREHLSNLKTKLATSQSSKTGKKPQNYASFLPPRLVEACSNGSLVPFFGSGISIAAGIPTWGKLLETLGIAKDYISDPHVEHDPLTQAELIAHDIGTDSLQQKLRAQMTLADRPSLAHYQLAALQLPVYITTNYDSLFEKAWKRLNNTNLIKVTNDADVVEHKLDEPRTFPIEGKTVLIKMHGDCDSDGDNGKDGLLILTRSDYRRHYRSNLKFFDLVKDIMQSGYVLFLGFGHRDPEVSRLVEDVVYKYERESDEQSSRVASQLEVTAEQEKSQRPPIVYSIQFDMKQRTPEVFAARGIVALRPPTVIRDLKPEQLRSASLAVELGELMAAADDPTYQAMSLKDLLEVCVTRISNNIIEAMKILRDAKKSVTANLNNRGTLEAELDSLTSKLSLAGQGVYVTKSNGDIAGLSVPDGLKKEARNANGLRFDDRPYFRQAKAFRKEFVSDVFPSIYNGHSTIFLCMPLGNESVFEGLLFAAAQPGAWQLPLQLRDDCWKQDVDFVLVDSNGIVIVPPTYEIKPTASMTHPQGELPELNEGFPYPRIQEISRRDTHILHIVQNVVPVSWDDDVHDVSADLRLYSMVADVPQTRWKLALSRSVPSTLSTNA